MSPRHNSSEAVIGRLVDDLQPVAPRRAWRDAVLLGGVALTELVLVLWRGTLRPDLHEAMRGGMFWWKMLTCLGLALAGGIAVLAALDPETRARPLWRGLAAATAVTLLIGSVLAGVAAVPAPVMLRLDMHHGMLCLAWSLLMGLPVLGAILYLVRRSAPTRPRATATSAGIAASGWGAFVFAWSCPHADPLYVLVWFGGAILVGAIAARVLLTPVMRW
ncbi:MAG TPA: DUF1109 domain-containing protein [Polymorphobacter sp.]|nr:DUF1109 domain-containing protein [Polymorphobacter sp.]